MSLSLRHYSNLLSTYLRPQQKRGALLAILLLSSISLELVNPQVLRAFIDTAQDGGPMDQLIRIALVFIGAAFVGQCVSLGAAYLGEVVGWSATNRLRHDLLRHTLRLDMPFHKAHPPGELIERVDGDVTAMANFFSHFTVVLLGNGLLMVGVLVLLWREDWRVGLGVTLYALITLAMLSRIQRYGRPRWEAAQQAEAELGGYIEERLRGTEDIRANGAGGYVLRRLDALMHSQLVTVRQAQIAGSLTYVGTHLLFAIGYAVGLALGAFLYIQGDVSIGTAFLITTYVGMLAKPLEAIRKQVEDLQRAGASIVRVGALLKKQSVIHENIQASLPNGPLSIELSEVTFAYNDDESSDSQPPAINENNAVSPSPVLRDVSFCLQPGRVLGVLGRTGSGKTTLTRLLFRLYDPTQGTVRIGNVDIQRVALADLRGRVGMVTQDVQLFGASLRDNITLFNRRIADAQILDVVEILGLRPLLDRMPEGLDTRLGSDGVGLSAGQAQLLACARVFLRDPGLVILDEASSRLDPATEALLEQAITRLLKNRTGIVIAHRLGTIQRADDILILDTGRVVEFGARAQLAAEHSSRFSRLLRTGIEEVLQ